MKETTFTYDARPGYKFKVTGVRYTPDSPCRDGLTIIAAHGNGTHKETYGALVSFLFDHSARTQFLPVAEVWSIECPNHGESAVLNAKELALHYATVGNWDGWEYSRAMLAFLKSRPDGVDFYQQQLVLMGHSNGGSTVALLYDLDRTLPVTGLILLDPALSAASPVRNRTERMITQYTWTRRDTWPDKQTARADLEKQVGSRYWHPKVMDAFLEKAVVPHPASYYPDPFQFRAVTLACTKQYESSMTRANEAYPRASEVLFELYRQGKAVHFVLSGGDKFGAQQLKEDMIRPDPVSGRKPTSVYVMQRGGHMFVQTEPEKAAHAIYDALCQIEKTSHRNGNDSSTSAYMRAHL